MGILSSSARLTWSGYLNCRHLSGLDRAVAEGALARPDVWDPLLQLLWERGSIHEQNYVEHLTKTGLEVVRIDGVDVTDEAVPKTLEAMKSGTPVIVQAALSYDGSRRAWTGSSERPAAVVHLLLAPTSTA